MVPLYLQRKLLWEMKDEIVEPFGETAIQVFARVSAMRDRLDGPQADDQVTTVVKHNIWSSAGALGRQTSFVWLQVGCIRMWSQSWVLAAGIN